MNDPLSNYSKQENCGGGAESPSAYASAESSPSQSMVTSLSMQSFRSMIHTSQAATNDDNEQQNQMNGRSTMSVSQSMNSFSSTTSSKTSAAQTSPTTHHIDLAAIPSSMSVSGIDALQKLEELNMQAFTSLPPVISRSSSTSSSNTSSPETVRDKIEKAIKNELDKSPKQTSPKAAASSVFSVLGRIFKSASKVAPEEKEKEKSPKINTSPVMSSSSTASSSSVNPDLNLFSKLAADNKVEVEETKRSTAMDKLEEMKEERTFEELEKRLNSNDGINSQYSSIEHSAASESLKVPASSQEFCMDLNQKAAAKVASSSSKSATSIHQQSSNGTSSSDDHQRFTKNASTSSIHNDLKAILEAESGVIKVESSAATLTAPTADSVPKKTQQTESLSPNSAASNTSTTSTSSTSKKKHSHKKASGDEGSKTKSADTSAKEGQPQSPPKQQREKKHRSKQSKSSPSDKSSSAQEQKAATSIESKINVLDLLMKSATVSSIESTTITTSPKVSQTVKRNVYRYSRDFLVRIRDERAKLIDNICPDIFRAHSYCISGAFWDPEKYFNAMLHGERIYDFVNNNHHSNLNNNKGASQTGHSKGKSYPHRQYNKQQHHYNNNRQSYNRARNLSDGNADLLNSLMKNSNSTSAINNQTHNAFDKYLLDLLKKGSSNSTASSGQLSPKANPGVDIMEMLNKKANTVLPMSNTQNESIRPAMEERRHTPAPRHTPLILTAQELEFSQLYSLPSANNTAPKRTSPTISRFQSQTSPSFSSSSSSSNRSVNMSPTSCSSLPVPQPQSNIENEADNTSDAYKQLVKNLSNHPLSGAVPTKSTSVDEFFSGVTSRQSEESQKPDILLKQLLHLNQTEPAQVDDAASSRPKQFNYKHNLNRSGGHSKPNHYYKPRSPAHPKSPSQRHANIDEALINKIREQQDASRPNEREHFNMLLEKLVPTLSNHLVTVGGDDVKSNDNILKWFQNPASI